MICMYKYIFIFFFLNYLFSVFFSGFLFTGDRYVFSAAACARRALKNKAVGYLAALCEPEWIADVSRRVTQAANMTDEISALAALDLAAARFRGQNKPQSSPLPRLLNFSGP